MERGTQWPQQRPSETKGGTEGKKNGKEELKCRQLGVDQSDLLRSKMFYCQFFCWFSLGCGPQSGGVGAAEGGVGSRVGECGGREGGSRLQDRDKFRGESIGSALTSLPLFVTAAVFKARNAVPVQRWKNSKQVH